MRYAVHSVGNGLSTVSSADSLAELENSFSLSQRHTTLILSASMDHSICVWSYHPLDDVLDDSQDKHLVARLEECPQHITCVRSAIVKNVPIAVGGGGDALIYVWSLEGSFNLLYTLRGHADEIQSLDVYNVEGLYPVLASGSWDQTIRVWNLNTMKFVRLIEGHRAEITAVQMFHAGRTDAAIASVSTDQSLRVMFDFLGGIPRKDFVRELFLLDCNSAAVQIKVKKTVFVDKRWPRIDALVDNIGPEQFFSSFHFLFGLAIDTNQGDFIAEYLPQCREPLLKTNVPYSYASASKLQGSAVRRASTVSNLLRGVNGQQAFMTQGTLLRHALEYKDISAVRTIVSCWGRFLNDHANVAKGHLFDKRAELNMTDLLVLQDVFPKEFENLINTIQLMPLPMKYLPDTFQYMLEDRDRGLILTRGERTYFEETDGKPGGGSDSFLFLPLPCMAHMDMMSAYCNTCEELDSVVIFDSDAGQLALSFAWRACGRKTHMISMLIYYFYVAVAASSIYTFQYFIDNDLSIVAFVLLGAQFAMDVFFIYRELLEFFHAPVDYASDMWNQLDIVVIMGGIIGNALRFYFWNDTLASKVALSMTSVGMWLNVLFYLRAFESTG